MIVNDRQFHKTSNLTLSLSNLPYYCQVEEDTGHSVRSLRQKGAFHRNFIWATSWATQCIPTTEALSNPIMDITEQLSF